MKRKSFKSAKLGAVIVAGMLLAAAPITALAEKSEEKTETVAEVKEETETKEEKKTEAAEGKTEEETSKKAEEETSAEESSKEETTAAEETKASDETVESGEGKVEEETKADTEESEKESETEAAKEDEKETTAAEDETTAEETTAEETTAAETKAEGKLASEIVGTWDADERTSLKFGENGKGELVLPKREYAFTYEIDADQVSLDFESSKVVDCEYTASVSGDELLLIGGKGTIGGEFKLTKAE